MVQGGKENCKEGLVRARDRWVRGDDDGIVDAADGGAVEGGAKGLVHMFFHLVQCEHNF